MHANACTEILLPPSNAQTGRPDQVGSTDQNNEILISIRSAAFDLRCNLGSARAPAGGGGGVQGRKIFLPRSGQKLFSSSRRLSKKFTP